MTDNRWYPHFDYAGEPMARGEFRDRQPTNPVEVERRNAVIQIIERLCVSPARALPPLNEHVELVPLGVNSCGGALKRVEFRGKLPGDGLGFFSVGYEIVLGPVE